MFEPRSTLTCLGLCASLLALPTHATGETAAGSTVPAPQLRISHALSQLPEATIEPEVTADLWQRVRAGFALPDAQYDRVAVHEAWFAARPSYLNRAVERGRLYLFHVVEEVSKRGMPMEIALLPVIESAYNPQAVSPQQASGIWQFIPSTGRVYGLRQHQWYDGRKDVLAATNAALDYLQNLHRMFGNWELALAAYNCGEGCVGRAIARNRAQGLPTDYASLSLPTETRHYVPKLLAVRNIVREPERFGIQLAEIANAPYFSQVSFKHKMEARQVARLADMDLDAFLALNPGFQRKIIHSDSPGVLLLPADKVEDFQTRLEGIGQKGALQSYQARRGESLNKIANKFEVTLDWLKEHNPIKLYRGNLASNQTLVVPSRAPRELAGKSNSPAVRTHVVRKGDTLYSLARLYKTSVADIRSQNQAMANTLRPGDRLRIPSS